MRGVQLAMHLPVCPAMQIAQEAGPASAGWPAKRAIYVVKILMANFILYVLRRTEQRRRER